MLIRNTHYSFIILVNCADLVLLFKLREDMGRGHRVVGKYIKVGHQGNFETVCVHECEVRN